MSAVSAASASRFVERRDLRGDLHTHTLYSDGGASMAAMAVAARNAGLEYIAITDHSSYYVHARGVDAQLLAEQRSHIDALNAALPGLTILHGVEVDIREDGTLALPDRVLSQLDVVIASVHDHFELSRNKQSERLLRAMERPFLSILGHPTARLLGRRCAMECDWDLVFSRAHERSIALELNCQPKRLDLDEAGLRRAVELKLSIAINSDAHSIHAFDHLRAGALQAQRAELTAADVLNTRTLEELREQLARARLG